MFGSYVQVEPVLSCRSPQNFEIIFHSFNGCVIFTQLLLMCFQAITRPELLTIPGEEHQGTPLHPYQIISLSVLAAIGAVKRQASGLELHWEPIWASM